MINQITCIKAFKIYLTDRPLIAKFDISLMPFVKAIYILCCTLIEEFLTNEFHRWNNRTLRC